MNRSFQFWLIYCLAWVPYAIGYVVVFITHVKLSATRAILDSVHNILPAALLGVLVIRICRKFTPANGHPIVFGTVQLILALSYAALWNLIVPLSFSLERLFEEREWEYSLFGGYALQWQFFAGLMIYATISSIVYALQFSQRVREEQARALRAEHLRIEAELNALRAHLNPHFLFNTLHSLMALVRRDSAGAEQAIERLADLLRYTLKAKSNVTKDDVLLSAEWKFVRNYLDLERLRLGDRLKVKADLSALSLDCFVPAFTLQPLVENAIKHAVSQHPTGGEVEITASVISDCLRLEVADRGAGALPDDVFSKGGTGLRLVKQRLETRYNGQAKFKIETAPDAGFRVVILIPQNDADLGDSSNQ
jgi:sensor histidine kinase YesM